MLWAQISNHVKPSAWHIHKCSIRIRFGYNNIITFTVSGLFQNATVKNFNPQITEKMKRDLFFFKSILAGKRAFWKTRDLEVEILLEILPGHSS